MSALWDNTSSDDIDELPPAPVLLLPHPMRTPMPPSCSLFLLLLPSLLALPCIGRWLSSPLSATCSHPPAVPPASRALH